MTASREAEEELRELAVGELAHRLKNKIATIQSVIGAKLRNETQIRDEIFGLLSSSRPPVSADGTQDKNRVPF